MGQENVVSPVHVHKRDVAAVSDRIKVFTKGRRDWVPGQVISFPQSYDPYAYVPHLVVSPFREEKSLYDGTQVFFF